MSAGLKVIAPGLMTSVQDRGRFGFQALGISVSGALDPDGFDLANALAGNEAGTGALEIRMLGPTLEVTAESVTLALAGTGAGWGPKISTASYAISMTRTMPPGAAR